MSHIYPYPVVSPAMHPCHSIIHTPMLHNTHLYFYYLCFVRLLYSMTFLRNFCLFSVLLKLILGFEVGSLFCGVAADSPRLPTKTAPTNQALLSPKENFLEQQPYQQQLKIEGSIESRRVQQINQKYKVKKF